MSQFSLSNEQNQVFREADRIGREELLTLAERMDKEEWWPEEIMPMLGELGFLGVTIPEKYGGAGLGYLESGLILQAFSRYNHAFGLSWIAHDNLCANNIFNNGSERQKSEFLPKLCSGEHVGCLGLTEPGAGSDALGSMTTAAKKNGDGYLINGSKIYITNGPIADICVLYAKTDKQERSSKGITAFVIETNQPGFKVAQKLKKMGFRGSQTAELVFENLLVPKENILGKENEGHKVVMSGLDFERATIAPISVGIAERALEISVDYAKSRTQFNQPIANFQMIQSYLAEMYVGIETMRALSWKVLSECGEVRAEEAGRGKIHAKTAASVLYCANTCNEILDKAVQIFGGYGYMLETEINRLFRSTKLLEIGAGTTEVRKMIIAKELLK
jgi:isovaleryl-CoA dehydrogenase